MEPKEEFLWLSFCNMCTFQRRKGRRLGGATQAAQAASRRDATYGFSSVYPIEMITVMCFSFSITDTIARMWVPLILILASDALVAVRRCFSIMGTFG